MQKITAVIIDDEISNIILLENYLNKYCPLVDLIGEANTISSAVTLINTKKPKLIFLDIMLDEGTGFDVLEEVTHKDSKVIFVSSHNEYAIKAFKYSAIDYVLKPIEIEDLILAVNKAYDDIDKEIYTNTVQLDMVNKSLEVKEPLNFIAIPSIDKIEFIKIEDIIYLQSDGRYTVFFLKDGKKIVASRNLGEYENIIDKNLFFRIHNSYIVNLKHVVSINKRDGVYCEMINRISLPIAKRRQDSLNRFLKIK